MCCLLPNQINSLLYMFCIFITPVLFFIFFFFMGEGGSHSHLCKLHDISIDRENRCKSDVHVGYRWWHTTCLFTILIIYNFVIIIIIIIIIIMIIIIIIMLKHNIQRIMRICLVSGSHAPTLSLKLSDFPFHTCSLVLVHLFKKRTVDIQIPISTCS